MITRATQVFVASTAFGLATMVAALDDGRFEEGPRRILITSNHGAIPEVSPEISDVDGTASLLGRFDAIFSYNELVRPQHPALWRPRAHDLPIWRRHLEQAWGIDGRRTQLIMESIQVPPALVLAEAFPDARIDVYADGLMSYGPTRIALPSSVAARIERVLHLDLVPGVRPLLLREFDVPTEVITTDAFRAVIDSLGSDDDLASGGTRAALLLGQYLSSAGLITEAEESALHNEMVRTAVAAGFRELIFKPHPSALLPDRLLIEEAKRIGARLRVVDRPGLVETWFSGDRVGLVVGCFSTALFTAAALYGVPTARVGTDLLLRRLKPYENSNRIPVVLADAAVPDLSRASDQLVQAVGYCMQPEHHRDLRPVAERFFRRHPDTARRYVTRRRVNELGLPGHAKPRGPIKQVVLRLLGAPRYRQLATAWGARSLR